MRLDMIYIDIQMRKYGLMPVFAFLAFVGLPSLAGDKQATTLRVRAVSYRAIPHETTSSYTTPGYSNTSCYGNGSDWGYITSISMNCQTVTTPPKEYSNTRRTMEG